MLDVVTDGMGYKLRLTHELADGPPVLPVNPAVCIANHHEVYPRFVNRVEAMNHVGRTRDPGGAKDNARTGLEVANHGVLDIGSIVDVDLPVGKVQSGERNVLEKSGVVPGVLGTVEAKREGVYHS
jgi:hypothetical protein